MLYNYKKNLFHAGKTTLSESQAISYSTNIMIIRILTDEVFIIYIKAMF